MRVMLLLSTLLPNLLFQKSLLQYQMKQFFEVMAAFAVTSLLFFSTSAFSQTWVTQSSKVERDLFGVYFTDDKDGIAVGEKATIIKTTNGGNIWDTVSTGFTGDYTYSDVCFANVNTGYIVGYRNGMHKILKTTNAGATWSATVNNGTDELYAIAFADVQTGLAVGENGSIYRTANGGGTWQKMNSGTANRLFDVTFAGSAMAFAVGIGGTLMRSADGGASWGAISPGTTADLNRVFFRSPAYGFIAGENGELLVTTDSGQTWAQRATGVTRDLYALHFTSDSTGYAAGEQGIILKTTDAGINWSILFMGDVYEATLRDMHFPLPDAGFAVGDVDAFNSGYGLIKKYAAPIAVEEIDEAGGISLYPNPATDILNIKTVAAQLPLQLTIFDLAGRITGKSQISTLSHAMFLSGIKPGIYFCVLTNSTGQLYFHKLIIQ